MKARSWWLILLAACGPAEPPVAKAPAPTAAPMPVASAAPAPGPSASAGSPHPLAKAWATDFPKTWSDPRVVKELAANCDFNPPEPPREQEADQPADLFHCTPAYEQACDVDPCGETTSTCESGCSKTCGTCGADCSKSCNACKTSCKDDACRTACASKCAECKQSCGRTMDKCTTGDCGREAAACRSRLEAAFRTNKCQPKCEANRKCKEACKGGDCWDKCDAKLNATFDPCNHRCAEESDGHCMEKCLLASCSQMICSMGFK